MIRHWLVQKTTILLNVETGEWIHFTIHLTIYTRVLDRQALSFRWFALQLHVCWRLRSSILVCSFAVSSVSYFLWARGKFWIWYGKIADLMKRCIDRWAADPKERARRGLGIQPMDLARATLASWPPGSSFSSFLIHSKSYYGMFSVSMHPKCKIELQCYFLWRQAELCASI